MGTITAPHNGLTTEEFLRRELNGKVIAYAQNAKTAYLAVSCDEGKVFGLVILFERFKEKLRYKFIDEGMGPVDSSCPEAILDILDPPYNEYAVQWRARCRAKLVGKAVS